MIQATTLQFLKGLHKNNNRDWFFKHKLEFEHAKQNYLEFVTAVLQQTQILDPSLSDLIPKQCVFRINRDVRFSNNKDPYKSNFGASFSKGAKKIDTAGYYFHLEPGASFIGGGLWMPPSPELGKVRQEIDYCFKEFKAIIEEKKFKSIFGGLDRSAITIRPPRGYEFDNPAIDYLKLKSFTAIIPISDTEVLDKNILKRTLSIFETISPLVHFLNRAIAI